MIKLPHACVRQCLGHVTHRGLIVYELWNDDLNNETAVCIYTNLLPSWPVLNLFIAISVSLLLHRAFQTCQHFTTIHLMTEKFQKDYISECSLFNYHVRKIEGSE